MKRNHCNFILMTVGRGVIEQLLRQVRNKSGAVASRMFLGPSQREGDSVATIYDLTNRLRP